MTDGGDDPHHGVPGPPAERMWRHPSEIGHDNRVHADRRRGRFLVTGLIITGVGVAAAAVVVSGMGRSPHPVEPATALVGATERGIVRIEPGGVGAAASTGVVVDGGHVLVSKAALGESSSSELRVWCDRGPSPARVVASDQLVDLALVSTGEHRMAIAEDGGDVAVGDSLVLHGFGADGSAWSRQVTVERTDAEWVRPNGTVARGLLEASTEGDGALSQGVLTDGHGNLAGWVVTAEGSTVMAYPSAEVAEIAADLLADGHVAHAWIGVKAADSSTEQGGDAAGAEVLEVAADGPAARAGVAAGDVVVSVRGRPVGSLGDLVDVLDGAEPGTTVELRVLRGGQPVELSLTLAQHPT